MLWEVTDFFIGAGIHTIVVATLKKLVSSLDHSSEILRKQRVDILLLLEHRSPYVQRYHYY